MPTIQNLLSFGQKELRTTSDTARLDSELLLAYVLKISAEQLFIDAQQEISKTKENQFYKLVNRRTKHEPIAYLIGYKEFLGRDFQVSPSVLIPRPETEILVEKVIIYTKDLTFKPQIFDLGTGSGCIAISLAKEFPNYQITAVDICQRALNVAQKNSQTYRAKITFIRSNLLEKIPENNLNKALIVANLPYVQTTYPPPPELNFEPQKALWGDSDGLKFYRQLLKQLINKNPQAIFLEIDPAQGSELKKISQKLFPNYKTAITKDLANHDRVFSITK